MSDANVKVNLALNYGNQQAEYESLDKQKDFLKGVFTNAVNSAFKNGVGKEYMRRFRDVTKKLDALAFTGESGEPDRLDISFTPHEFKFVNDAFDKATWNPGAHTLVCQLYDRLEEAKK